ncbi:hypothetical protein HJ090_10895 [Vibrio parahaemolyticus]|nr:hypothetical protein [Vibrio parahaemolyticus]
MTANDLINYTNTNKIEMQELLPNIVKKLILASCKVECINIPTGDMVSVGGWDGIVSVKDGNKYVPKGVSGWEFGTNKDVKSKADDDYNKRTKKPLTLISSETTYVSVTSRLWSKCSDWVNEKNKDKKWKQVIAINAETLEDWLHDCPAVHRWLSEKLGKRCNDVYDIEQEWESYLSKTKVRLNTAFFLNERECESDTLIKFIKNNNSEVIRIKGESKLYSLGFVMGTLKNDDYAISRSLIIKSQKAWDLMCQTKEKLILIPYDFEPSNIGFAAQNGHCTIVIQRKNDFINSDITLKIQSGNTLKVSISNLGFNDREAKQILIDTDGVLEEILEHNLLQPIYPQEPKWLNEFDINILFSIFTASTWKDNNPYDIKILEQLSGCSYDVIDQEIKKACNMDYFPIKRVRDGWKVISKTNCLRKIDSMISSTHMKRLHQTLLPIINQKVENSDVFIEYSINNGKEYATTIGISYELRTELCFTIDILSSNHINHIDNFLNELYNTNNPVDICNSLGSDMYYLCNADPDKYITSIENILDDENSINYNKSKKN